MTKPTGEIHRTGLMRELPVKLDLQDMVDVATNKSMLENERDKIELKAKEAAKVAKAEVEALDERIATLRAQLIAGERRTVIECFERWRGNLLEVVRGDTNAVVETRTATLKDTQADLPAMAAAQADAAKTQADAGVSEDDEGDVVPIDGGEKKKRRGAR